MRDSKQSSLLMMAAASMAVAGLGPGLMGVMPPHRARRVAVIEAPRQKTEVEAWNEAVEKRKAEKKARKQKGKP